MRFRLEDAHAQGFYVSLRTLNAAPANPLKPLPQATNIAGVYVVFGLDGRWRLTNSTVETWNQTIASGAMGTGPLKLHAWYRLKVAVQGQQLTWSVTPPGGGGGGRGNDTTAADEAAATLGVTLTLAEGFFPPKGQLGIGLVDYGLASVDDLSVTGMR